MEYLFRFLVIFAAVWLVFLLGAIAHESDMATNYAETGDAKAWFFDIKVTE